MTEEASMIGDQESYGENSVDDEDQLDPQDTLESSDLTDELDRGYTAPESYSPAERHGTTDWETAHPRPLDERLAEEVPEGDSADAAAIDYGEGDDWDLSDAEVGDQRAGRLVAPDLGSGEDDEAQALADDVGLSGAGASAEEAAVHVIDRSE
jgi:hypothetical protein